MHKDTSFFLKGDNAYLHLCKLLQTLLPANEVYHQEVTLEKQKEQLELLDPHIANENFYFVLNLLTCELEHIKGVKKWLGYSNTEFTFTQYLNCIHPDQVVLFNLIARGFYRAMFQGIIHFRFTPLKYISMLALRHYDGEYYVYKKTSSVFQYDDKNRILAEMNEFNRIELYDGTALKPRFEIMETGQRDQFEEIVCQQVYKEMLEEKYFSEKEFEILKYYAEDTGRTSNDVAYKMNVKPPTIDTYNKRILEKARKIFTYPFNNAREVAWRLKKEKIL